MCEDLETLQETRQRDCRDSRPRRYLAAQEEIYGAHLAMNANAPLPCLTVPRDRRCIFERHSKRRGATLTIGRRFPPRTFQYGNQFRRVAPRDSSLVNRHRCTNARQYIHPSSHFSLFSPSVCLVSFEPTLFDARQISLVLIDFALVLYALFQFQQWYLQNGEHIRRVFFLLIKNCPFGQLLFLSEYILSYIIFFCYHSLF